MVSLTIAVHAPNATSHIAAKCGSISRIVGLWSDLGRMEPVYLVGPRGTQDCAALWDIVYCSPLAELWAGPHGNTPFATRLEHRRHLGIRVTILPFMLPSVHQPCPLQLQVDGRVNAKVWKTKLCIYSSVLTIQ